MSFLYHIPGVRQLQTKLNQLTSYIPPPPREVSSTTLEGEPLRILLVHAHPNAVDSFSSAIANQVESSAQAKGHQVRRINLYEENYDPRLSKEQQMLNQARGEDLEKRKLAKEVKTHIRHLQWCDTLVFVYPTWWMNTPAILKGWFDRTLVHDLCWALPVPDAPSKALIPKLTHITQIVGISTYGAPPHIVTLAGDNGRRCISNAVRPIMSPQATVQWLGLYNMDSTTPKERTDFLQEVKALVQRL
jgi:putative NADPH-quinone reductase